MTNRRKRRSLTDKLCSTLTATTSVVYAAAVLIRAVRGLAIEIAITVFVAAVMVTLI